MKKYRWLLASQDDFAFDKHNLYRIFLFAGVSYSTVIKTEKSEQHFFFSHEKVT